MRAFHEIGRYTIADRGEFSGPCIVVQNPGDIDEPNDLRGQSVLIDGRECEVVAVESFMCGRPYPRRLNFTLMVKT